MCWWNMLCILIIDYMNWNKQVNEVLEDIIKDIMFLYPETSREVAELSAATMIRYPKMLIELSEMVKDKHAR